MSHLEWWQSCSDVFINGTLIGKALRRMNGSMMSKKNRKSKNRTAVRKADSVARRSAYLRERQQTATEPSTALLEQATTEPFATLLEQAREVEPLELRELRLITSSVTEAANFAYQHTPDALCVTSFTPEAFYLKTDDTRAEFDVRDDMVVVGGWIDITSTYGGRHLSKGGTHLSERVWTVICKSDNPVRQETLVWDIVHRLGLARKQGVDTYTVPFLLPDGDVGIVVVRATDISGITWITLHAEPVPTRRSVQNAFVVTMRKQVA